MFDDVKDLYSAEIRSHGRTPRHGRRLPQFDATARGDNPMCGDRVQVFVRRAGDTLAEAGFVALMPDLFSAGGARRCLVSTFRALRSGHGRAYADIEAARTLLAARADGTRDVAFEFLTGERNERHPPVEGFSGNPVLMIFLEHDVRTLKESIGVSTTYWRNRLRDALLQSATVEDVTATVDGRTVPARKVSVRPFEGEDRLRRVPPVRDKLYTFILADAVPGGIVEIRTDMPADAGLGVPAAGESLVFNRTQSQDAPGAAKP